MRKQFEDLKIGDIIWANTDIGGHIHILYENSKEGIICVNSINLTKSCDECKDYCILINGKTVPDDWFKIKADIMYIRLTSSKCISEDEYRSTSYSYKGNIKQKKYNDFWNEVCQKCAYVTKPICNCSDEE